MNISRIGRALRRWADPLPDNALQAPQPQPQPGQEFGGFLRRPHEDRRGKLLQGLDLARLSGAEIGPLDRPLVRKTDGSVIYVDHADTEALRTQWASDPNIDTSRLQVDAVWGRQSLLEGISASAGAGFAGLDYVVASHVIEHVPDVITWLQEIQAVLKPGGQLRLAVPDKRFTFDYLRRTSDLASMLYAWKCRARVPNAPCILDFCLNMAPLDMHAAWRGPIDPAGLKRGFDFAGAMAIAEDARLNSTYHDVHCWVFTPASLARCFAELARQQVLAFACERFHDTEVDELEFMLALRQCNDPAACTASWERVAGQARVHAFTE